MNRMLIVYMHSVRTVCKRSDYERARAKICSYLLDGSRRAAMRPMATNSELQSVYTTVVHSHEVDN